MANYVFIAGMRDHNCILTNSNYDIESIDELKERIKHDVEEANEIFGLRWRGDFDEVEMDDIGISDEEFDRISDEIFIKVDEEYKIRNK